MIPMFQQQQRHDGQFVVDNIVPARVNAAMDFAWMMAKRRYPIIATRELEIHVEPAPPLTKGEVSAHDAACMLLCDYFGGQMDLDIHEESRLRAIDVETDRRRIGRIFHCGCKGAGCDTCEGSGKILVIPAPSEPVRDQPQKNEGLSEQT